MVTYEDEILHEEALPEVLQIEALEDRFAPDGVGISVWISVSVGCGCDCDPHHGC